jgi:putative DNA primase/helicase
VAEGCLSWQAAGLRPPEIVLAAVQQYRQEQDVVGHFLSACTVAVADGAVMKADLYMRYVSWAKETGENQWTQRALGEALRERGIADDRVHDGRRWIGLRLASATEGASHSEGCDCRECIP